MKSEMEEIKRQIPFYVNDTLQEEEKERVEEALEKYPEIRKELLECSRIKDLYDLTPAVEPPPALFSRIKEKLPENQSLLPSIKAFLTRIYKSPAISWGLVAAQAIVVLLLVWHLKSPRFETLSAPSMQKGVCFNLVFKENTQEKGMRDLLNRIGATIIEGPSREGLYIIKLKNPKNPNEALKEFKESGKVKFVAKCY